MLSYYKQLNNFFQILPVLTAFYYRYEISLVCLNKNLLLILNILKTHIHFQYNLLTAISGVDLLNEQYRFCVVYELLSVTFNSRVRLKVFLNTINNIDSSVVVFKNANWWEREVWDMFGIFFKNHPDLRRLLSDYGFEGYPLRKDFPLSGYIEIRYNENKKKIMIEPISLSQEYRLFSFELPW